MDLIIHVSTGSTPGPGTYYLDELPELKRVADAVEKELNPKEYHVYICPRDSRPKPKSMFDSEPESTRPREDFDDNPMRI